MAVQRKPAAPPLACLAQVRTETRGYRCDLQTPWWQLSDICLRHFIKAGRTPPPKSCLRSYEKGCQEISRLDCTATNSGRVYETKKLHSNQSFRESAPEAGASYNTHSHPRPGRQQNKPVTAPGFICLLSSNWFSLFLKHKIAHPLR